MATGWGRANLPRFWPLLERLGYPRERIDQEHVDNAYLDQRLNHTQIEAIRVQAIRLASRRIRTAITQEEKCQK